MLLGADVEDAADWTNKSLLSSQFWYMDIFIAILSLFDWTESTERSF